MASVYTNCETAVAGLSYASGHRIGRMLTLRLVEEFVHVSDYLSARFGMGRASHLELGRRGEEAAFFYLRRRGYIVVARDWRSGKARGDLDLVAWEGQTLCFIEVKTRGSRNVATAESAVDQDKARVLRRLARQYLLALPDTPDQVRFDVLSIYYEAQKAADIQLFRGAFDWH
ncbi:MAG: YraN family protein [Acidobacteriaceae bacterium]